MTEAVTFNNFTLTLYCCWEFYKKQSLFGYSEASQTKCEWTSNHDSFLSSR